MGDVPNYSNLEIRRVRPWVAKPRGKIRVYDGDTFYSDTLDLGWGVSLNKPKFRIMGIDTPEKGWRAMTD